MAAALIALNHAAKHSGAASQDHAGYGIAAKKFRANPLGKVLGTAANTHGKQPSQVGALPRSERSLKMLASGAA
jgi:hypothetical protein